MFTTGKLNRIFAITLTIICLVSSQETFANISAPDTTGVIVEGTVMRDSIQSVILRDNKVGLQLTRSIRVYLPPGYSTSKKKYPVLYYCHSIYGTAQMIINNGVNHLLDRAFSKGVVQEFIFVVADYSTSNIGTLYENSPVSGMWIDFTTKELVPYIDKHYRTIANRNSRAVTGDFMGGRGALKLGMVNADLFGVVYAMHPVALAVGTRPWTELGVNWEKIFNAKKFEDLGGDRPCETFVAICQAFLPNPSRPPFYCDYFIKKQGDKLIPDPENMIRIQHAFHLNETLNDSYKNLQSLRGLAIDWARYDGNYDHVHAARTFTRDLEDLGIEHEAEEYRGTPWNHTWNDDGRFYTRVLPFLQKHLVFE